MKKLCVKFSNSQQGQSAVELAIFGSILMFVIAMIFRQGLNGGNFMNTQLKATRYAMSKSFEQSVSANPSPGRNSASVLIIEDRLSGDFTNKYSTRDRAPLIAGGGGSFTNQLFYPVDESDYGDEGVLPHYDMWINGQRFSFTIANFKQMALPTEKGTLADCGDPHPTDTRCWDSACTTPSGSTGCLRLHRRVENYKEEKDFKVTGNFDVNFDKTDPVPAALKDLTADGAPKMYFQWQWLAVSAIDILPTENDIDVDGDFYEERILESHADADGRTDWVRVIDRQDGDLDFTVDGRRPNVKVGLLDDSQMFSFTKSGTFYRIEEGKLYSGSNDQFIRNVNRSDHVDIVQRVIQLNNDTKRFCDNNTLQPNVEGEPNPVEACNNCFSGTNARFQQTCFDTETLKLFVRSRIQNKGGRSWFTRTEEKN